MRCWRSSALSRVRLRVGTARRAARVSVPVIDHAVWAGLRAAGKAFATGTPTRTARPLADVGEWAIGRSAGRPHPGPLPKGEGGDVVRRAARVSVPVIDHAVWAGLRATGKAFATGTPTRTARPLADVGEWAIGWGAGRPHPGPLPKGEGGAGALRWLATVLHLSADNHRVGAAAELAARERRVAAFGAKTARIDDPFVVGVD
jgi:hypothetical protein